jgi:hypothetical protein
MSLYKDDANHNAIAWGALLAIAIMMGLGLSICLPSCTPAERAVAVNDVNRVLSDVEKACADIVILTSVIPVGTPADIVIADIDLVCHLDASATPALESLFATAMTSLAVDGGVPMTSSTQYRPSALVARAKGQR